MVPNHHLHSSTLYIYLVWYLPVTHENRCPRKQSIPQMLKPLVALLILAGSSQNPSGKGFLFSVILHSLSCSTAILTCSLLTALIQETEIKESRLCLAETKFLRMTAIRKELTGLTCPHLVWLDGGSLERLLFIPPTMFEFIICVKGLTFWHNVTVLNLSHILKWIQMDEQSSITLLTTLPSSLFCSNRVP